MTIPRLAAVAVLTCIARIGWSQTSPEDHAAHHPLEQAPDRMMMESNGDLATIRGLLEKAEQAKSPAERERLLDEHLAAMRKQLAALESQPCEMNSMEGGAMGGDHAGDSKPGMMDEGMKMGDRTKMGHMMMCHQLMTARMKTVMEFLGQTWRRDELRKRRAN